MAGLGGKREGAGRKTKAEELQANVIIVKALVEIYDANNDDNAKIEFVKTLYESERGMLFLAQHVFGKPQEKIDITTGGDKINITPIEWLKTK